MAAAWSGSSPLARGLLRVVLPRGLPDVDHPRSRGVYLRAVGYLALSLGSSPLARGLRRDQDEHVRRPGIIPARAGFTRPDSSSGPRCWDHPRSRGVYPMTPRAGGTLAGSSPLARGLHQHPPHGQAARGIIPARAGFTASASTCARTTRDHPRSRGVYGERFDLRPHNQGSSPLARGLRGYKTNKTDVLGIIPARAGFTGAPSSGRRTASDHPRSRGVYGAVPTPGVLVEGSSPLARGLH